MSSIQVLQLIVFSVALGLLPSAAAQGDEACGTVMTCSFIETPPVMDGTVGNEWTTNAFETSLQKITGDNYEAGPATLYCVYDTKRIYLALEIPGDYRFSNETDQLCASIGTMFQIGPQATLVNMGGCPDAMAGCTADGGIPETCQDYLVDIGAHWRLKGTQPNKVYGGGDASSSDSDAHRRLHGDEMDDDDKGGNDPIANKDDEYAVSPHCRKDDDGPNAGNEWMGAWSHTNPVEGESGTYQFELSRTLETPSSATDVQLKPGATVRFGVAFWDPFETEESGWTSGGHYVSGCGSKWIDLELVAVQEGGEADDAGEENGTSAISKMGPSSWLLITNVVLVTIWMQW